MDDRQLEEYLNRLSDSTDDDFTSQQLDADLSDVEDHVELDEQFNQSDYDNSNAEVASIFLLIPKLEQFQVLLAFLHIHNV